MWFVGPLQQFSAGSAPENADKKYEVAPESAKKFVGASAFTPPLDIKGDVFAEMEARIARVERTWDRQGDKVPPLCKMGGGEMVRVSEIAQVGPGGAPYRFGGSPRGEGPPRLWTRGGPHTRPTPCGVGQPRLRLGIVAQRARRKAESIHDRGKGGLGSGGISPHFDRG